MNQPYPPQYGQQPYVDPYAQQAPPQFAPQPAYAPPPTPAYPQQIQQPYPPQFAPQPAQPPVAPLVNATLDDYYSQPSTSGGPGVSWKGKPDGYTVQGIVQRDVSNSDVSQEVGAPNTREAGVPQFYRDGRPKLVMAIPLTLAPSHEFPDGEARLFIRGQLRDELTRAMGEAGVAGSPVGGAVLTVTLVQRKQGRGTIPQNIFRVVYTLPGQQAPQVQQPQAPQAPAYPPQGYAQPQVQFGPPATYAPQGPQQIQQPQYAPQPVQQQPVAPGAGAPSPVPAPAPQAAAPAQAMQPPQGLDPERLALFNQLTGQQPATPAA